MKAKISTVAELELVVSTLRRSGVKSIIAKNLEFEMRLHIIQQCNPKRIKFAVTKLPKFDGNFTEYQNRCLEFFNDLYEKKTTRKNIR